MGIQLTKGSRFNLSKEAPYLKNDRWLEVVLFPEKVLSRAGVTVAYDN